MYEIPNVENVRGMDKVDGYICLCGLLEVKPRSGQKSIDAHFEHIKRFIDLEKIKGSRPILIHEIYEEPMPRQDKKSPYEDYIQLLLLNLITRNENEKHIVRIGYKKLLNYMDFINEGFIEYRNSPEKLVEWLRSEDSPRNNIEGCQLMEWHKSLTQQARYQVETGLNKLSEKKMIIWHKDINYCANDRHYAATDEDAQNILMHEKRYLQIKGFLTEQEVVSYNKWDEYKEYVTSNMKAHIDGFQQYYPVYKIIYIDDNNMNIEKSRLIKRLGEIGDNIDEIALKVNSIFIQQNNNTAENRKKGAQLRKDNGDKAKFYDGVRLKPSYLSDIEYMNKVFIERR